MKLVVIRSCDESTVSSGQYSFALVDVCVMYVLVMFTVWGRTVTGLT